MFRIVKIILIISVATIIGSCSQEHYITPEVLQEGKIPIIYGTDLFHPHDDPDDHFDLATVFAMPELDVKAILLDQGARQQNKPGRIPIEQMLKLTARRVPYATALSRKLVSPDDKGLDQPKRDQAAVELLLQTLRESPEPVVVITTGSVRDVCAAFNREPNLLREKISTLYINIGNLLQNKGEWNVQLDRKAYVGLMRSGLPIYWCPCLPVNENRSTHWKFKHGQILEHVPPALLNWFIYALQVPRPHELDPIKALNMDLRPWRHILMNLPQWRNGGTLGDFPFSIEECFRHSGTSVTTWLDGHTSEIKETTGEDVPRVQAPRASIAVDVADWVWSRAERPGGYDRPKAPGSRGAQV